MLCQAYTQRTIFNQIQIVYTMEQLVWNQMNKNQSVHGKYNLNLV